MSPVRVKQNIEDDLADLINRCSELLFIELQIFGSK